MKDKQSLNKEKLFLIHPDCSLESKGGSQTNTLELAQYLSDTFLVKIVSAYYIPNVGVKTIAFPRSRVQAITAQLGVTAFIEKIFGNPYQFFESRLSFFPILLKLLKYRPEVVFPNNGYGGLSVANWYRKLTNSKIVYTEHAGVLHNGKTLKRNLKYKPDVLIVFDKHTQALVQTIAPKQRTKIIPNGVNLSLFSPEGDTFPTFFDNDNSTILVVATLNRGNHKRVQLAINAVQQIKNQANLLICGSGKDTEYFQQLCDETLSGVCKIISCEFSDMPKLYRSVDLFTLPSEQEPFGKVYLEALACGLGVVATSDSMRETIVGDAGVLCDVENPQAYADALLLALNEDWTYRALNQSKKFCWAEIAEQYKKTIKDLISDT